MNQVFKVRASSWASLFDCAYKWEGIHMLGIKSPSSPRALLGTAIHASTAAFDQGRIDHSGYTANDTADVLASTLAMPPYDVSWKGADITPREALAVGLQLHTRYCNEWSPRFDFVAVEMAIQPFAINCGNGITVELTGTLDRMRLRRDTNGKGISDLKSGGAAVEKGRAKTKGHAAQIGTYELLTENTIGERLTLPGEIIGLKTNGAPEIATGEIHNGRDLMLGTDTHKGLIEFGSEMFRTGLFPPNPQSQLCSEKYCPRWATCPYHD